MRFRLHHAVLPLALFLRDARRKKFSALLCLSLLPAFASPGAEPARAAAAPDTTALDYMIVVTGEELLDSVSKVFSSHPSRAEEPPIRQICPAVRGAGRR